DLLANVVGTMAQHDNDLVNATVAQVVDAALANGFVSEGQQRLERAHAAGAAGGEKNGCDLRHWKSFLTQRRNGATKHAAPSRRCVRKLFRLQVAQGAQRVLPRHLLAPLVDEVGVVEWSSFDVSRFSRRLDLI